MNSVIIFCAQYLFVFVVMGAAIAWLQASGSVKLDFAVSIILAGVVSLLLARIAAKLYFDPRPFVAEHIRPLISHAADNGFPSDHALFTMTLTAVTCFFSRKLAAAMLVLTVAVGIARVLAGVHSPLDIFAGWVIGILGAVAGYYIMRPGLARLKRATRAE